MLKRKAASAYLRTDDHLFKEVMHGGKGSERKGRAQLMQWGRRQQVGATYCMSQRLWSPDLTPWIHAQVLPNETPQAEAKAAVI